MTAIDHVAAPDGADIVVHSSGTGGHDGINRARPDLVDTLAAFFAPAA